MESKQIKPISVYEVLIAPSGVEKSKYINIISNSCTDLERYMYDEYFKKNRSFVPAGINETTTRDEQTKTNTIKTFDNWINHFGSIKQVYTTPSLLRMMASSSIFFLANEGDAILQESSFYNPSDVTSDIKQSVLIDCWDGNKIVKSTITHGSQEIKDRTVSICVATTGRRWPDLLRELAKVQIAGGLQERCTYFCFDIHDETSYSQLSPTVEQMFYSDLYDQLLSTNTTSVQINYSLAQLLFIIKLFGHRIFIWSREAFAYIQPRLMELKSNKSCKLIPEITTFKTKQQMALRRRSAEHIVRYSCLLQMFSNVLLIMKSIDTKLIDHSHGKIVESLESEARHQIIKLFGPTLERANSYHSNGVPVKPLRITIDSVKSAVALVCTLLIPQAAFLFDYDNHDNQLIEQTALNDANRMMSKQEKTIFQIESFILKLNHKFFHKSCITDHHFRDKRGLVDDVLNDLVHRQLLHQAPDNKPFFDSGRVSSIKTYMKFLPSMKGEERFRKTLSNSYNIDYDEYKKNFQLASLLPPNCKLTSYGTDFLQQSQYALIMNKNGDGNLNQLDANTHPDSNKLSLNHAEPNSDDDDHEPVAYFPNNLNHYPSMVHSADSNQHKTMVNNKSGKTNVNSIEFHETCEENSFPAKTIDLSQNVENPTLAAACIQSNEDTSSHQKTSAAEHHEEEEKSDDVLIDVVHDDSSSLLSSTMEEPVDLQIEGPVSEELRMTSAVEKSSASSIPIENEKEQQRTSNHTISPQQELSGKILLIPSVLLTKGLISAYIKISANERKQALEYLLSIELLSSGKYLQCSKRKIDAYLKYVPENIEDRTVKYVLQSRLLNIDVNVDEYIESLRSLKLSTTSQCPSELLLATFRETGYMQLNINYSILAKNACHEGKIDEHSGSSDYEVAVDKHRRKKVKPNDENE